jgi:rhodanese-related sulfurtransferase
MAQKKTSKVQKPKSHQKTPPKSAQVKQQKNAKKQNSRLTWLIPVVIIVVGAIIAAVFLLNNNARAAGNKLPATMSVNEAAQRFEQGAFLLDVRTVEEWNENHIDGAVLIPLNELDSRVSEIPTDQDVLIICRSGNRSATARDILRGYGLNRTTSISGGINAWMSAGLPVVSGP